MKLIESLQTGEAWNAAIAGGFPSDLSSFQGVLTSLPATFGFDLINNYASMGLDVIKNLSSSPDSLIGLAVAGIKAIYVGLQEAAAQREVNYAEARVGYLANVRGIRIASKIDGYQGCRTGYWNYPRAGVAKDHCVPIWDPLGTENNFPKWMVPYNWTSPKSVIQWPEVGNWLPRTCYDWEDINADFGDSDCDVDRFKTVIVGWPWAWPLSSPIRATGNFLRYSKGPEKEISAQYMLPTPQHILTNIYDVDQSKITITKAMKFWWPGAYEASPGKWLNNKPGRPYKGFDPKNPASGAPFEYYSMALSRIDGFYKCRKAILENPTLIPYQLQELYSLNYDFDPIPNKPKRPKLIGGIDSGELAVKQAFINMDEIVPQKEKSKRPSNSSSAVPIILGMGIIGVGGYYLFKRR